MAGDSRGGAWRARALALWWNLLIPALIAWLTWAPRNALAHSLDLVTDEGVYIPTGAHDLSLLQAGKLTDPYWLVNFEAPSFPKLIMGLGSSYGVQHYGVHGALYGARLPGVLLIALTLVISYFLARPIFGRMGAALGALMLALSPWLAFFNSIAYLDTYLLCFMTLAALLTWHAARRPWLWPVVGALGGLAFASKYTAAFVAVPIVLYLAFYTFFVARRRPPWQVILIPVVGMLTAYIADPAIWVNPASRLYHSIMFQYNHASNGHDAFWNGVVGTHVPPGIGLYILLAKMSLFVTIPSLLALVWAAVRIVLFIRANHPIHPRRLLRGESGERTPLPRDADTAAFIVIWLGGMLPLFGSLNIIVGAHYVLPLAPPVAFSAGWAYVTVARRLAPRVSDWLASAPVISQPLADALTTFAFVVVIALAMLAPSAYGLVTVNQAEGYTAEWLPGENPALQVAYPGYSDAVQWITAHSQRRTTVTLVMGEKGALDYWLATRQSLFPQRIRLAVSTPDTLLQFQSQYIVWPEHLVQRQFPKPANFNQLIVHRITGGQTTYCYILRWPTPNR